MEVLNFKHSALNLKPDSDKAFLEAEGLEFNQPSRLFSSDIRACCATMFS